MNSNNTSHLYCNLVCEVLPYVVFHLLSQCHWYWQQLSVDKSTKRRDLSSTQMESVNLVNGDQNWASDLPPQLSAFPIALKRLARKCTMRSHCRCYVRTSVLVPFKFYFWDGVEHRQNLSHVHLCLRRESWKGRSKIERRFCAKTTYCTSYWHVITSKAQSLCCYLLCSSSKTWSRKKCQRPGQCSDYWCVFPFFDLIIFSLLRRPGSVTTNFALTVAIE